MLRQMHARLRLGKVVIVTYLNDDLNSYCWSGVMTSHQRLQRGLCGKFKCLGKLSKEGERH